MLPIFSRGIKGQLCLKPFLHLVFEELFENNLREFCFIVGKGKRSIEDYFTLDDNFIEYLKQNNKPDLMNELDSFYKKIRESTILFINQPKPLGFGNAIHLARSFTGEEPFIVHAGDDLIISKNKNSRPIERLITSFEELNADATFFVQKIDDPRKYGVIVGEKKGNYYIVKQIIEKPLKPPSKLAVVATYVFNPKIYEALDHTLPNKNKEIQISDSIQYLIDEGYSVYALELNKNECRIDFGTPESFREAMIAVLDWLNY